ncbi:MAG: hypothetical protein CMB53_04145 [Euryarchaeota archaeon]|nr:hypothetical protein [Euryarchaeota archaeon]|tara:strand:+ start:18315 stop:18584 length:270 start_codon:yes stop_codon:yes gene_type:complete
MDEHYHGGGSAIKVSMLFFGPLAERFGQREVTVSLDSGTTTSQLIERFELRGMLDLGLRVAVDGKMDADLDKPLSDSTEVAFLPPVSGG